MAADADVLDFLREQFNRVHTKLDRLQDDVTNLKVRMSVQEAESGHLRVAIAEVNARLDRIDRRIEVLERRADILPA